MSDSVTQLGSAEHWRKGGKGRMKTCFERLSQTRRNQQPLQSLTWWQAREGLPTVWLGSSTSSSVLSSHQVYGWINRVMNWIKQGFPPPRTPNGGNQTWNPQPHAAALLKSVLDKRGRVDSARVVPGREVRCRASIWSRWGNACP